ncbi:TIGR02300 family protein [Pseudooceanicola sp. LIPI14-2-Ac024]|uniref:TIGR02300 family protein n=1 Tax=Pseudooceanicola sp. LIPI14-2-Ac024 TaxID=3344875 RepID=UPI0035D0E249
MPKEEWGTKRVCPTTGKRFYDLNAVPIISPYTGEVVEIDVARGRTIVADAEDAETKKLRAHQNDDDDADVLEDDDDDVDVDLDDDLLEDDDDDDNVSLDDIADVSDEESED